MRAGRALRYAWAGPNTMAGLVLAVATRATGGRVHRVEGVLEASGGVAAWLLRHAVPLRGGAQAITLGHVVLARDEQAAACTRRHERVHVQQYERWGPLFLPAYFGASAWAWLQGADPYRDNPFERAAFANEKALEP